jgi:hypothetical protein
MHTEEAFGARLVDLLSFNSVRVSILPIEKSAFGRFYQQPIRIFTVGEQVRIEALVGKLRSQKATRSR